MDIATQIRRDVIRMVHGAKCGHPGGAMGCAEYLSALFFRVMDHHPEFNMDGLNEDIFFLSNGHICAGLYSVLARSGYFPVEELGTFRQLDSRLQGHPATHEGLPGIRIATGSLGQGLSVAVGAALTKKLNDDKHIVYSLHGDGELQEGQNWEAFMFAAHHKVDNIIAAIDWNDAQIDGTTQDVMDLGDLEAKIKSFGWEVLVLDGNKMEEVLDMLTAAKALVGKGKPIALLLRTKMAAGVDFMSGNYKWHGKAPNDEQAELALAQLEETLGDY